MVANPLSAVPGGETSGEVENPSVVRQDGLTTFEPFQVPITRVEPLAVAEIVQAPKTFDGHAKVYPPVTF